MLVVNAILLLLMVSPLIFIASVFGDVHGWDLFFVSIMLYIYSGITLWWKDLSRTRKC